MKKQVSFTLTTYVYVDVSDSDLLKYGPDLGYEETSVSELSDEAVFEIAEEKYNEEGPDDESYEVYLDNPRIGQWD